MAKKLLTTKNTKILRAKLKEYLLDVLEDDYEENYKTIADCRAEAKRVKNRPIFRRQDVKDWLQGLSLGISYTYYAICCILLEGLGMSEQDIEKLGKDYAEDMYVLDRFYWTTLADIIYND